ncbi:hypothetical protein QYE76_047424 [Lolium multiflorum]|uniref:Reverse transcriptase Ty1/copia-type domain-containing protein n=1 Tax=Lolium multiflorum TaxID=4521 RepID=A0AAD8TRX3_LOLMU|nr:hypothetical protein QYE76_047424 [Lolium multiflorum]
MIMIMKLRTRIATEPRIDKGSCHSDWYDPCLNVMIVDNNDEDLATYEEAMMSPDSNKWQEAMKSEMGSMYDNKVWTLVDLPDSRKAVENKWIFKRKPDADGNITIYKARLVAKGFRQIQGVDYDETFSPAAKLKSMRILLAIAAFLDYEIWQMDVKTAFLNGDIEEELYMVRVYIEWCCDGWASSKQCTVAKSSTESEYIAAEASSEAVWMKRFIVEFGVVPSALDPLVIYCDNMGAIANAQEQDPLTKVLPRAKHDQHQNAMGVSDGSVRVRAQPPPAPPPARDSDATCTRPSPPPRHQTRVDHRYTVMAAYDESLVADDEPQFLSGRLFDLAEYVGIPSPTFYGKMMYREHSTEKWLIKTLIQGRARDPADPDMEYTEAYTD